MRYTRQAKQRISSGGTRRKIYKTKTKTNVIGLGTKEEITSSIFIYKFTDPGS